MSITDATPTLTTGQWTIEPAHSSVGFTVRHLGLSKVRGQFNSFTGSVTIAEDQLASSVTASVDLSSPSAPASRSRATWPTWPMHPSACA